MDYKIPKQLVFTYVENAVKHGIRPKRKGGWVKLNVSKSNQYISIKITDNGIGIPKENLPHLFERFYRVDKDRSRISGGTGLGLSIVKHIMEAHNQSVHVRSTVGIGTTFGFTLKKKNII